ncbi:hypothetical protein BpHYR1_012841 [Brachionus plicatilis]|uniref:Uncharacterized protein n=1 Tax=Brachionus plicatilis TaxID=10195 RepID=A0A3M7PPT9_BRAPC|nr:hypothetical protein BpHYR1_012841 [Brachionus plicatilis]
MYPITPSTVNIFSSKNIVGKFSNNFVQREIVLLETFEGIIENISEFNLPFLECSITNSHIDELLDIKNSNEKTIKNQIDKATITYFISKKRINLKLLNQLKFNYLCLFDKNIKHPSFLDFRTMAIFWCYLIVFSRKLDGKKQSIAFYKMIY